MNERAVPLRTGPSNVTVRQAAATPDRSPVRRSEGRGRLYLAGARVPISLGAARVVWDSARCADADPELFFPERGEQPIEALQMCAECPVRELCLDTFGPIVADGVVGGQTAGDRRRERARRRAGGSAA